MIKKAFYNPYDNKKKKKQVKFKNFPKGFWGVSFARECFCDGFGYNRPNPHFPTSTPQAHKAK